MYAEYNAEYKMPTAGRMIADFTCMVWVFSHRFFILIFHFETANIKR